MASIISITQFTNVNTCMVNRQSGIIGSESQLIELEPTIVNTQHHCT